ncbi:MAG: aspartate/glutamate racemase family protein [Roseovarius sp.]|nr:aspartate/glutamate racemase family protein [Roseovarius sp.]MCY4209342.1 aspartate/glutamate racemase family protein [Roseovarius sp.]MCY4291153.1 aspartate/glutamate racemase family protein [Roseovarius sp.]MCY4314754.1 aspartate/glutamate racemase family protein [Roseovarius sp.]
MELIENLPFETERVIAGRARIGMVVLASDYTVEREMRRLLALPGVDVFHARIANSPEITPDTLRAMGPLIANTAELILPGDTLDVLAYACTSASMTIGPDAIANYLHSAKPEAKATNPAHAAFAAFKALSARRIAVLAPYSREVNEFVQRAMEEAGFSVPVFGSFNESRDPTVAAITTASLKAAVARITRDHSIDAVFVSCTSIRIADDLADIEADLGIPVTSSNHALAWHCLRLAGIDDKMPGNGRLYSV